MPSKAQLLLIDNDPDSILQITQVLEPEGYDIGVATNIHQAFSQIRDDDPDLILIDISSKNVDSLALCRRIKQSPDLCRLPILLVSEKSGVEVVESLLAAGADDHITKPIHIHELSRRLRNLLELSLTRSALAKTKDELQFTQEHLQTVLDQLDLAGRTDLLTGLHNKRQAMERIEEEAARFQRNRRPFSLALADIDHFQTINAKCGNDVGDFVLRGLAASFKNAVRRQDFVGRWGGQEFLFTFPETDVDGAYIVAEKIRRKLENFHVNHGEQKLAVRCTFGLIAYDLGESLSTNIQRLHNSVLDGKKQGGNKVVA